MLCKKDSSSLADDMYLTSEFYTVNEVGQKSYFKKGISYEYDMHIFGDKRALFWWKIEMGRD